MGVKGGTYYCDGCGASEYQRPAELITRFDGTWCSQCKPPIPQSPRPDRDLDTARVGSGPPGPAPRAEDSPDLEAALEYARSYDGDFQFMLDMRRAAEEDRRFTPKMIAAVLKCKAADDRRQTATRQEPATPSRPPVEEAGMYSMDGTIYKVQKAVHGSGNLYAKRLIPPDVEGGKARFEYAKGIIRRLSSEDRLTLEEAKQFGALYGTCAVCGRTLTDEESIEAGIGPVCAGRL